MASKSPFSNMFGRSPIGPIQNHIYKVHECATQLLPFIEAVIADDWAKAEETQKLIASLESEANKIKKDVRKSLPKSLFMPVPRSDLLDIVRKQDKVANRTKDIAGLMLGRQMKIPASLADAFHRFVERSVQASAQALKAINELDELLETGFSGREVNVVEDMIDDLDAIERDSDDLQVALRLALFKLEADLPPIDVMFMYQIIDWIGDLSDRASRVGNQLQLLLAR